MVWISSDLRSCEMAPLIDTISEAGSLPCNIALLVLCSALLKAAPLDTGSRAWHCSCAVLLSFILPVANRLPLSASRADSGLLFWEISADL